MRAAAASASLAAVLCCLTRPAAGLSKGNRLVDQTASCQLKADDDTESDKNKKAVLVRQLKEYGCRGDFHKKGDNSLVAVIAGHPGCDVTWLADQPHDTHIISDIGKDGKTRYTGFEGGAYLNFILKNYDNLPDTMAFMHGHRKSWEVNDEENILKNLDAKSYPYAGLSKKWAVDLREPDIALTHSFLEASLTKDEVKHFPKERFNFSFPSGGSFLVSKERVLARSKETWQRAYDWLETSDSKNHARALEFSWHILMGEPAQMTPPNPAKLCPKDPAACQHEAYVDDSFPKWRLQWYNSHDVGGEKIPGVGGERITIPGPGGERIKI